MSAGLLFSTRTSNTQRTSPVVVARFTVYLAHFTLNIRTEKFASLNEIERNVSRKGNCEMHDSKASENL